ncbi:MAG TPA: dihydroorotase [Candidatus Omnitrophota bacterium]|nr:dihydroorotase [Candidatus Omnitrophota bacterium]HQO37338.1 dihydroorotase [Candidatus Omnitrophota bacterium]HQQ05783.1 dihydroorotase [Candidatus Omnitrophota bacterium]
MKILIKGGRVIDPANNIDDIRDILIESTRIARIGKGLNNGADKTIDAAGKIVMPGFVDMHVHLREPGREDKETVATGTQAALRGGITTMLAMPNTIPTIDSEESARLIASIIRDTARSRVLICGAITKGRMGKVLADMARLKKEGVIAVSDDGSSVDSSDILLKAMKKAREQKMLVICHCEDKAMSAGGVMNLGANSTRLGLRGISNESEYKRIQRDIMLAQKAKCSVHIAHVSCAESIEIIAKARKKGVTLTCETAPHYFSLTEEAVLDYDTNKKMNPPLRTVKDRDAVRRGLVDGVIDVIASDHAPHTVAEKEIEFDRAEFGVTGLETEIGVAATYLVHEGLLSWSELVRKMALNPAKILGIDKGTLSVNKDADIIIVDPSAEWTVNAADFASKSKNSCFLNERLKGKVVKTLYRGTVAYSAD